MAIAILLVILMGGGVSVAAQNSLPGDSLYDVKLGVNERVAGWLAVSNEAEAMLAAKLAGARLREAEKLTVRSELDTETRANIEANFERQADKVNVLIAEFEAREDFKAAAEVSSNLETSLRAHAEILARLAAKDAEDRAEVTAILNTVNANIAANTIVRSRVEAGVLVSQGPDVKSAAEGKLGAAENKIAEVESFIENRKAALGVTASADAEARLEVAETVLTDGKAKLEAEAYGEAFILFQKAHDLAQEAKLLVEVGLDVEAVVNVNVGINPPNQPATPGVKPSGSTLIEGSGAVVDDDLQGGLRLNIGR